MKLLFDNNLSPKLVAKLARLYPTSGHVAMLNLDTASDIEVWEFARQNDFCLVTKDADFNELLSIKGFPPKIIWIRLGNCTTTQIFDLLNSNHETILDFIDKTSTGMLELI